VQLSPHVLALAEAAGHPLAAHSRSVAELASGVAEELGLDADACQEVQISALLHDLGKVAMMDEILYKPDGLSEDEVALVRQHPARGQEMLERLGPEFTSVARIVRSCHERWNGGGYPDGIAGEEIPLAARIIFCCDAYDAMTSDRPYSKAMSPTMAIGELWTCAGSQFDPDVVAALVRATARSRSAEPVEAKAAEERVTELPAARLHGAAGDRR
jgi:putative nucleotidyltransferase with HDIG domain